MEVHNLVISYDRHKCRLDGHKGVLKTVNIVETLPNGKSKTVHKDIHFETENANPGYRSLLKLFKKPTDKKEIRRAA